MARSLLLGLALVLLVPARAAGAEWQWPVRGRVIERFRLGPSPFVAGQHRGIDIAAPAGTPVRAACPGPVRFAGVVGGAGPTVSVRCGPLSATYVHLGAIEVRRGAELHTGDLLGTVAAGGGEHSASVLHLGARRLGERFGYVDPLSLLGEPRVSTPPALPLLGRAPRGSVPQARPRPAPIPARRPALARQGRFGDPASAPALAWAGVGLGAVGLSGLGLTRRSRRARRHRSLAAGSHRREEAL